MATWWSYRAGKRAGIAGIRKGVAENLPAGAPAVLLLLPLPPGLHNQLQAELTHLGEEAETWAKLERTWVLLVYLGDLPAGPGQAHHLSLLFPLPGPS